MKAGDYRCRCLNRFTGLVVFAALLLAMPGAGQAESDAALSDEAVKLPEPFHAGDCETKGPKEDRTLPPIANPCALIRTGPPMELGPHLLGLGKLKPGFKLPTGAVWQPALYLLGGVRSALNVVSADNDEDLGEIAIRADIAFNLQLTATERVVLGFAPLNDNENFTNYQFEPDTGSGYNGEFNSDIEQFWFEGDFGELFPDFQKRDNDKRVENNHEYGFSIGRQPLFFQDGMLIADTMDAIGIVRNNLQLFERSPSTRLTFLFAWNDVNRADNRDDADASLFGVFGEADTQRSIIEFDAVYVRSDSGGDGINLGYGSTQRLGFWSTTFRLNASHALDEESAAVADGVLLFFELSRAPLGTHNVVYFNGFAAIGDYTSASRGETTGGALGRTGILFAAPGLGRFSAPLSSASSEAFGAAIGYQWFFDQEKSNLMAELGLRNDRSGVDDVYELGLGLRYQHTISQRWLFQTNLFIVDGNERGSDVGLRTEFNLAF